MAVKIAPGELTFHHVGLLTGEMNNARRHYGELFGETNISDVVVVESQKVQVCFVRILDGSFIELISPIDEDSVVYKLLKKRTSYYHMAYTVTDIYSTVSKLEEMNYKAMDYFNSEAFGGKKCIFLFTPDTHLIELIEK